MTEQTVETPVTETEDVPQVDPMTLVPDNVRPLVEVSRTMWETEVGAANALAQKLRNVGNHVALVHEMRDSAPTDDEEILAFRKWRAEVDEAILAAEAKVEARIKALGLVEIDNIDEDKVKAEYKDIADRLKGLRSSTARFITDESVAEAVFNSWPALIAAPGTRVSSGGIGKGAGVEKARIAKILVGDTEIFEDVDGKDGEVTRKVTLTILTNWLSKDSGTKVEGSQVREALLSSGNVSSVKELNGRPVTFAFTAGDKTYPSITVTPAANN